MWLLLIQYPSPRVDLPILGLGEPLVLVAEPKLLPGCLEEVLQGTQGLCLHHFVVRWLQVAVAPPVPVGLKEP